MARFIVIPLYDHTGDAEVEEVLADLARLKFAIEPYVAEAEEAPKAAA